MSDIGMMTSNEELTSSDKVASSDFQALLDVLYEPDMLDCVMTTSPNALRLVMDIRMSNAYAVLGLQAVKDNRLEDAYTAYSRAIDLVPYNIFLWLRRSDVLTRIGGGLDAYAVGDAVKACGLLQMWVEAKEEDACWVIAATTCYCDSEGDEEALEFMEAGKVNLDKLKKAVVTRLLQPLDAQGLRRECLLLLLHYRKSLGLLGHDFFENLVAKYAEREDTEADSLSLTIRPPVLFWDIFHQERMSLLPLTQMFSTSKTRVGKVRIEFGDARGNIRTKDEFGLFATKRIKTGERVIEERRPWIQAGVYPPTGKVIHDEELEKKVASKFGPFMAQCLLLLAKVCSLAIETCQHPLEIPEVRLLNGPQENEGDEARDFKVSACQLSPMLITLLEHLGVSPYSDSRFDTWVMFALMSKIYANAEVFWSNNNVNYSSIAFPEIFVNHSCKPNIVIAQDPNDMGKPMYFALTDIDEGDELRRNYLGHVELPYEQRQKLLLHELNRICRCLRCVREGRLLKKQKKKKR